MRAVSAALVYSRINKPQKMNGKTMCRWCFPRKLCMKSQGLDFSGALTSGQTKDGDRAAFLQGVYNIKLR